MVEQGTHKPLVVGSNPTLAIFDPYMAVMAAQRRIYGGENGGKPPCKSQPPPKTTRGSFIPLTGGRKVSSPIAG